MVNQEQGEQGKKSVLFLRVTITTRSKGGSRSNGGSSITRISIMVGRTIMVVPMTSGISEKRPCVVLGWRLPLEASWNSGVLENRQNPCAPDSKGGAAEEAEPDGATMSLW